MDIGEREQAAELGRASERSANVLPPGVNGRLSRSDFQRKLLVMFALASTLILGSYLRLRLIPGDFPLGDGGMFYLMISEVLDNDFRLPAYTEYNSAHIPFAYSPFPIYLSAVLSRVTGWPVLEILRLLPPVISILTIPAMFLLARQILRSELEIVIAVIIFAVLPTTMSWMIVGGGITRVSAMLFTILALYQTHRLLAIRQWRFVLSTAILTSLTLLSHPEWGWCLIFVIGLSFLFCSKLNLHSVSYAAALALLGGFFTAPWWLSVIHYHGLTPFASALASGAARDVFTVLRVLSENYTDEPMIGIIAALGLLGFFVCLAQRRWYLSAWALAIPIIDVRAPALILAIPVAMLAAVALVNLIIPGLTRLHAASSPAHQAIAMHSSRNVPLLLLGIGLIIYTLAGNFLLPLAPNRARYGAQLLAREERTAMQWIAANTESASRFLVITEQPVWWSDYISEWFPALTGRASLATAQGTEWRPGNRLAAIAAQYPRLQYCARWGVDCLSQWASDNEVVFTHVYVSANSTSGLRDWLAQSPDYRLIYDQDDIRIFERIQ